MQGEELDRALHDIVTTIWKAYRESVTKKDFSFFNEAYKPLEKKYGDNDVLKTFLVGYWMGFIPAANRRIHDESYSEGKSSGEKSDKRNQAMVQMRIDG